MIILENKARKNTQFIGGELTYKWFYKGIDPQFETGFLISDSPVRLEADVAGEILKRVALQIERHGGSGDVKITNPR